MFSSIGMSLNNISLTHFKEMKSLQSCALLVTRHSMVTLYNTSFHVYSALVFLQEELDSYVIIQNFQAICKPPTLNLC
jgi:hypothetical protein